MQNMIENKEPTILQYSSLQLLWDKAIPRGALLQCPWILLLFRLEWIVTWYQHLIISMELDFLLYMLHKNLCSHQQFSESTLLLRVPTKIRKSISMINSKEIKFEFPNFVLDQHWMDCCICCTGTCAHTNNFLKALCC